MRGCREGRLLVIGAVLIGLTGCGVGAVPAEGGPPQKTRNDVSQPVTSSRSTPRSSASAGPAGARSTSSPSAGPAGARSTDRRKELLAALRQAGVPVSSTGDREIRAAEMACRMVDQGADADELTRKFTEKIPLITRAKARELADIVISTYCRPR